MVLPLRWPVDYRAYRPGETSFLTDRSVITVTPAPFAAGAARSVNPFVTVSCALSASVELL